jgi:hypothetical protein
MTVQVLCGCGWGSLSMPVEDVPATCPVCGQPISDGEDFEPEEPEAEEE